MTGPQDEDGLWLVLPQGRFRLPEGTDVDVLLSELGEGPQLPVQDEDGRKGVAVLPPGGTPVVVLGRLRRRPPPTAPNPHD